MLSHIRRPFHHALLFSVVAGFALLLAHIALAQTPGMGAGENPSSDNSRTPFEIRMSGVLNPTDHADSFEGGMMNVTPDAENIAVVTLGISQYNETYRFEIGNLEAPGNPQLSARQVLQKAGKKQVDLSLIGPSALLSKVAQSPPGTPLTIVGMYEQRNQRLQLTSVEVIGTD